VSMFHVKPSQGSETMRAADPTALGYLRSKLDELAARDLLRAPMPRGEGTSFCSNDYLGMANRPAAKGAGGAGAARLIWGDLPAHHDLERKVAEWLGVEAALAFSSGYAANVGALSALIEPGDLVVSDALNHASIIDGIRLAKVKPVVVPHLDLPAIERALGEPRSGRAWVVTESYFSMDADTPDLRALRSICDRAGAALVVDEAHALGLFGPKGRGLLAREKVKADVLIGTFGKAFGASGAFVAGSVDLYQWLWNRARSFVFSTGMSPVVAATALANLESSMKEPMALHVESLAAHLRRGLSEIGIEPLGHGHIVPWVIGDAARAVRIASALCEKGVLVRAVRPPTVPQGTARIRFTVTAAHTKHDIAWAIDTIASVRDLA